MLILKSFKKFNISLFVCASLFAINGCKPPSNKSNTEIQTNYSEPYLNDFSPSEIEQLMSTSGQAQINFNSIDSYSSSAEGKAFIYATDNHELTKQKIIQYYKTETAITSLFGSSSETTVELLTPDNSYSSAPGEMERGFDEINYKIDSRKSFATINGNIKIKINNSQSKLSSLVFNSSDFIAKIGIGFMSKSVNVILKDNLKNDAVFYPYQNGVLVKFTTNITINNILAKSVISEHLITKRINSSVANMVELLNQ